MYENSAIIHCKYLQGTENATKRGKNDEKGKQTY